MKYSLKALILMLGIFVFGAFNPINDDRDKEAMILHAVLNYLDVLHFDPKPIDDDFSKAVLKNYIQDLDPAKRFLTQADLAIFSEYETEIDDQIRLRTFGFFDQSVEVIDNAYKRSELIFNDVITSKFDFSIKEEIELDYDNRTYPADDIELRDFWRKYIKYDILNKTHNKLKRQEDRLAKLEDPSDSQLSPLKNSLKIHEERC